MSDETATTDYGQIVGTTLTEDVEAAIVENIEDFDIPAIVADYREAIQGALPEGVTIHGEGILYGPWSPYVEFDRAEVLESVDFWAIVQRHDRTQTAD